MASYGFVALDKAGKEVKGSIEAENEAEVQAQVRARGLTVLEIKEQSLLTRDLDISIGGKPTPRDISVFCRQFVSMLRAGVSILEALKLLSEQTENKVLRKAILGTTASVEKGESLANSMADYPKIFNSLMLNTIAAGEASGSLDIALERMALQNEKVAKNQALVKKAMIYPIAVLSVALIVVVIMLVIVIPKYETMFAELGTDLPGITKAVLAMSRFITGYWYILVPVIIAVIVVINLYKNTDGGKKFFGTIALKLPIFGPLNRKNASSMLARTMSTLLSAGVPMEDAIEITSRVMPNVLYKEALLDARTQVLQGVPLSKPLEECGLFPPMVYHMIRIGEESGSTDEMLVKLADYYDEEVQMATEAMAAAMEPLIIVVLAVIVGGLVAACIAPMLSMYGALDSL